MKHDSATTGKRRSVNLSIDREVIDAARAVGINLSQVSETALRGAVRASEEERWRRENRAAFAYWNAWVEDNGLPLAAYRMF